MKVKVNGLFIYNTFIENFIIMVVQSTYDKCDNMCYVYHLLINPVNVCLHLYVGR